MYSWIWKKLPFGTWGKLSISLAIVTAISAVLWIFVFPAIEPYVTPFGDVQVGDPNGGYGDVVNPSPSVNPSDNDIPYSVTESPSLSPSKKR